MFHLPIVWNQALLDQINSHLSVCKAERISQIMYHEVEATQKGNTEWLYQTSSQQRPNLNIYFQNIVLLSEWNENEWKEGKKKKKPKQNLQPKKPFWM